MKSRTLFVVLLVVNLGLAGALTWSLLRPKTAGQLPGEEHVESVHLLGEMVKASAPVAKLVVKPVASAPVASSVIVPAVAESSIPTASPVLAQKPVLACLSWGDLSGKQWIEARLLLQKKLGRIDFEERMNEDKAKFWVYIPPAESLADARKAMEELKTKGFNDALIIQDSGPQQFAISLGLFSKKSMAEQFLAKLKAKDVTEAVNKPHPQSRYISVLMRNLAADQQAEIKKMASGFEKTTVQSVACPAN